MADNYLERKMEEHRSGRKPTYGKGCASMRAGVLQPGLHVIYPPMKVAIFARDAEEAKPFATAFRSAGITVALSCADGGRRAVEMSQQLGIRLYPDGCEPERLLADFGRVGGAVAPVVDLSGIVGSHCISLSEAAREIAPECLARELLFLIHPDHEALLTNQTLFELR